MTVTGIDQYRAVAGQALGKEVGIHGVVGPGLFPQHECAAGAVGYQGAQHPVAHPGGDGQTTAGPQHAARHRHMLGEYRGVGPTAIIGPGHQRAAHAIADDQRVDLVAGRVAQGDAIGRPLHLAGGGDALGENVTAGRLLAVAPGQNGAGRAVGGDGGCAQDAARAADQHPVRLPVVFTAGRPRLGQVSLGNGAGQVGPRVQRRGRDRQAAERGAQADQDDRDARDPVHTASAAG
ncbi:MAG: hypothetical protein HZY76_16550 [Anaerolineae bacterium]|nr:MAG: hypothetical protein HZY76_16550 [Anaerolineae bacterium]